MVTSGADTDPKSSSNSRQDKSNYTILDNTYWQE